MGRFAMEYSAEDLKRSGVYLIRNIVSEKVYVGSTLRLGERWVNHRWHLQRKSHANKHLQRAWNRYGEECFGFNILEFIENNDELIKKEQFWIEFYNSCDRRFGYNLKPASGYDQGRRYCLEVRQKIGDSHRGKKRSKKGVANIRKAQQTIKWSALSPNGDIYEFYGLKEFCRQHDLDDKNMCAVSTGKALQCKGWRCARGGSENLAKLKPWHSKKWIAISPTGQQFNVLSLRDFARNHDLDHSALSAVANGKQKQHKGWRCLRAD